MAERQMKETISSSPKVTVRSQQIYTEERERRRQEKNDEKKKKIETITEHSHYYVH